MVKIGLVSSAKLQPAFHAYEQAARHDGLQWRELVNIVTRTVDEERRTRLDSLAHQPSKNGQPRGGGKQVETAAPAVVTNEAHKAILEKYPQYCWRHMNGTCTFGSRCRFSHAEMSPVDAMALFAARKAQGEASTPGDASPVRGANAKRGEGVCHAYADGRVCTRLPHCPYRHGDSPEEVARVAAVHAKGKGKGKSASGAAPA